MEILDTGKEMIKLKDLLVEAKKPPQFVNWKSKGIQPKGLNAQTPAYFRVIRPTLSIRTTDGKPIKAHKGAFVFHLDQGTYYVDPDSQTAVEVENRNKNFKGSDMSTWPLYQMAYTSGELKQLRSAPLRDSEWKAWLK